MRQLLESDRLDRWDAATAFGRPVVESYREIIEVLTRYLSSEHAALFAEPELSNGGVAWFTETPGEVLPWRKLSQAQQAHLLDVRKILLQDIAALAARFAEYGANTTGGTFSRVLAAAVDAPTETPAHLYAVGEQPVATFWGFRPKELEDSHATANPGLGAASTVQPTRTRSAGPIWIGLILLSFIALVLGWTGRQQLSQTKPSGGSLALRAWTKHDMAALAGCWSLGENAPAFLRRSTGIIEQGVTRAGKLCFDKTGHGSWSERHQYSSGVMECEAPISAEFDGAGRLAIHKPSVPCDGPSVWLAREMTCTPTEDGATATCAVTSSEFGHETRLFRRVAGNPP